MSGLSVVMVDDDEEFRTRYRDYFAHDSQIDLVGEAGDGAAGVTQWQTHRPDVVMMDLNMPTMAGDQATQHICDQDPQARVLVLTVSDSPEQVASAFDAGACGYLVKTEPPQAVAQAIEDATAGHTPLSSAIKTRLVELWRRRHGFIQRATEPTRIDLTGRDRQIIHGLELGQTNAQIAAMLSLTEGSVKQYVHRLAVKLGVRTRLQILRETRAFEAS
ncbi:MAG: response regulator transcription factor [Propionibacteriaceae bacterium]|jgi:DNA-binding NarL/FixJ family response regulator|nr:response regulator transcription factor [Propionibacteriaceae bacterium]